MRGAPPASHRRDSIEILTGQTVASPLREVYGYQPGWGLPSAADTDEIVRFMSRTQEQGGSRPPSSTVVG